MKKEYYPILGMFLVLLLLLWPLYINNLVLFNIACGFAAIVAAVAATAISGAVISGAIAFTNAGTAFTNAVGTIGAVAIAFATAGTAFANAVGTIGAAAAGVGIISGFAATGVVLYFFEKKKYNYVYIIQFVSLILFSVVSFNVVS